MKSKEVKEFRLGELFCGPGASADPHKYTAPHEARRPSAGWCGWITKYKTEQRYRLPAEERHNFCATAAGSLCREQSKILPWQDGKRYIAGPDK